MAELLSRLPPVRGKLIAGAPLADITWLRVGGPAEVLFLPADEADLARFLAETPRDIPVQVLGAGSNTLVRDGGLPGVTVRLTPAFGQITADGLRLRAGGGAGQVGGESGGQGGHCGAGIFRRRARHDWRRAAHECRML